MVYHFIFRFIKLKRKALRKKWDETRFIKELHKIPYRKMIQEKIDEAVHNSNTSLVGSLCLKWKSPDKIEIDSEAIIYGYPNKTNKIDNDKKHITRHLAVIEGKYVGSSKHDTEMHKIEITNEYKEWSHEDIAGISGSPVVIDGDAVGVVSRAGNGFIYFISLKKISRAIT